MKPEEDSGLLRSERVLLVDDERDFVESLAERMEMRGISVTTATTAAQALELIDQENFDAIVLDLLMPEMDGIETLKAIKERRPEAQVVLLTGHATVSKGVEAMKLGAVDVMEKPADIAELTERVHQAHARRVVVAEKQVKDKLDDILKRRGW
jgi:DNA-binding NtrC family response regulator